MEGWDLYLKENLHNPQEEILPNDRVGFFCLFFISVWRRWTTVMPTRGHFPINFWENHLFSKERQRPGRGRGARGSPDLEKGAGMEAACNWVVRMAPLDILLVGEPQLAARNSTAWTPLWMSHSHNELAPEGNFVCFFFLQLLDTRYQDGASVRLWWIPRPGLIRLRFSTCLTFWHCKTLAKECLEHKESFTFPGFLLLSICVQDPSFIYLLDIYWAPNYVSAMSQAKPYPHWTC